MTRIGGPVRVLVVDDHPVVRDGLAGMLGGTPWVEVVGACADGAAALSFVAAHPVDVVLMDLRMPGMGGVEAIRALAARAPDVRVLVVTTFDTEADVLPAIEAGATGYLLKDSSADTLLAGIRAAHAGRTTLSPTVADRLVTMVRSPSQGALSPREREVLALAADGATNKDIAARLFVSETTVKTHLLHVFDKLGVRDRAAAVSEGHRRGILR
ncbi:response regulator transcription factor [Intrasporangium sp.]|uniref:response regulator transcription factor n=1 Tax=Intrasporangium sp. TaxID=1925024 RepID=UPI003221929B